MSATADIRQKKPTNSLQMLIEAAMEKYIDLHTHSLKSDGSMTPSEVVEEAKRAGLSAIAVN